MLLAFLVVVLLESRILTFYSPQVEFCGYTIPHPSENKMNLRIQTTGTFSLSICRERMPAN